MAKNICCVIVNIWKSKKIPRKKKIPYDLLISFQLVTEVDASDLTDLSDLVGPELATLVTPCSPPASEPTGNSNSSSSSMPMDIRQADQIQTTVHKDKVVMGQIRPIAHAQ